MFDSSLSVGKLCQLALRLGKEGETLASQILPLYLFPTLWTRENEFNRVEAHSSIDLLLKAFGKQPFYKDPLPSHLMDLEESLPSYQKIQDSQTKAKLVHFSEKVQGAFVNQGEYVPLGALKCGSIEIPALGPHLHPLNDSAMFGTHCTESAWSAVSAQKEIWFDFQCSDTGFASRFMGVTPGISLFFVFYVKAQLAFIGEDLFTPRSLQRYHHHAQKVTFYSDQDRLSIENKIATKMQLIPLAGEGCFWDSDYLLAYEIPTHDSRVCIEFS